MCIGRGERTWNTIAGHQRTLMHACWPLALHFALPVAQVCHAITNGQQAKPDAELRHGSLKIPQAADGHARDANQLTPTPPMPANPRSFGLLQGQLRHCTVCCDGVARQLRARICGGQGFAGGCRLRRRGWSRINSSERKACGRPCGRFRRAERAGVDG